jgi:hypothetical protein
MASSILSDPKPCKKCGTADRNSRGECRSCVRAGAAARRPRYKEKMAEYAAAHAVHRKAYMDEYNKSYYEKNCESVKQAARDYLEKNRASINEKERARYAPEQHWRKINQDRNKEAVSKYLAENSGKRRVYEQCRRARKRKAGGVLSLDIGDRLYALQKGKCACCRLPLGDDYHLDHIMPLALGGPNTDDNIQLLRAKCNQQKSAKHPIEFMRSRGLLL